MNNPTDQTPLPPNEPDEVSLVDILNFISETWKKLALASCIGALLGFGWWYQMASYNATLILNNQDNFDLINWRSIQKALPRLAQEMIDEKKVPAGLENQYAAMKEELFWEKSFAANFAVSKLDAKSLVTLSKALDNAGSQIISFNLDAGSMNRGESIKNVLVLEDFIRQGGSYLALRALFAGYETRLMYSIADIQMKISTLEVELGYQQERVKRLENLLRRFPTASSVVSQVVDAKDSGSKYLPLTTQIIAANADINTSAEALQRYQDELQRLKYFKVFVDQTKPFLNETYDGLSLIKKMLLVSQEMQKNASGQSQGGFAEILKIRTELGGIENHYTQGLIKYTVPVTQKKGRLKSTVAGFAFGFFLMLVFVLARKVVAKLS